MNSIHTDKAPAAIGPYSQGVSAGVFLFTSGQLGIDPASGVLAQGIVSQAEQALKNIGAILAAAGLTYKSVIKTTCFLKDMGDFAAFNEVYARFFPQKPARSCVEVGHLPKDALVEIEVVAEK